MKLAAFDKGEIGIQLPREQAQMIGAQFQGVGNRQVNGAARRVDAHGVDDGRTLNTHGVDQDGFVSPGGEPR